MSIVRYALTIHQPWADLIVSGTKPVENRSWKPSAARCPPGSYIAIHASSHYDVDSESRADTILRGLGHLAWRFRRPDLRTNPDFMGALIGVVRYMGPVRTSPSPWFFGPVGWVFEDPVAISSIRCPGRQGLWPLHDLMARDVESLWAAALRKVGRELPSEPHVR